MKFISGLLKLLNGILVYTLVFYMLKHYLKGHVAPFPWFIFFWAYSIFFFYNLYRVQVLGLEPLGDEFLKSLQ